MSRSKIMRVRFFILIPFLLLAALAYPQSDTLNRLNAAGKKQGYWTIYLDQDLVVTRKDSARFIAYEIYDNGKKTFQYPGYKDKYHEIKGDSLLPPAGLPVPVNGTFIETEYGRIITKRIFKDGFPVYFCGYSYGEDDSSYVALERFFSVHYNNIPGSYLEKQRDINHHVSKYWYRPGERGWREYEYKSDPLTKKFYEGLGELKIIFDPINTDRNIVDYRIKVLNESGQKIFTRRTHEEREIFLDSLLPGKYKIEIYSRKISEPLLSKSVQINADHRTTENISLDITSSIDPVTVADAGREPVLESSLSLSYVDSRWLDQKSPFDNYYGFSFTHSGCGRITDRVGVYMGGGLGFNQYAIKKDTTFLTYGTRKTYESYNYLNAHADLKLKISSGRQKYSQSQKLFMDIGATYNFPLIFRHNVWLQDNKKLSNRGLHQFTDVRAFVNIGYGYFCFFGEYRLTDFIIGSYPEIPVYNFGIRFTGFTN